MRDLRGVVWSEFASAALAVVTKEDSRHSFYDDENNARAAAKLADWLMAEFDQRFPKEQEL